MVTQSVRDGLRETIQKKERDSNLLGSADRLIKNARLDLPGERLK